MSEAACRQRVRRGIPKFIDGRLKKAHSSNRDGQRSLVSVVDDDESVRESLPDLLREFGFAAEAFSSAEAFLASDVVSRDELPDPRHRDAWHVRSRTATGTDPPAAGDPDRVHHRAEAMSRSARACSRRGRRVPVQAVQQDGAARRTQRRASGEVSMTTMFTENVARAPYTVSSSSAGRAIEVVTMPDVTSVVFVVDDDVSVRESLELLISGRRVAARNLRLGAGIPVPPSRHCSVLPGARRDAAGLNGLELQQQLAERTDMPIIFITGHGDVPMSVQAMKAGAVEFLTKPFKDDVLLDAIRGAIERSRAGPPPRLGDASLEEAL